MHKKDRKNKNKRGRKRRLRILEVVFFILIILIFAGFSFEKVYAQKIYPGVKLGTTKIGGKTQDEVKEILQGFIDQFSKEGFVFKAALNGDSKTEVIYPLIISPADPDLSREVIDFKIEETLTDCYKIGREGNLINRFKDIWRSLRQGGEVELVVEIDKDELEKFLKNKFQGLEKPAKNVKLLISEDDQILITSERSGMVFDYQKGITNLEQSLIKFENGQVNLRLTEAIPEIKKADAEKLISEIEEIINFTPVTLVYKDKEWIIEKDQIKNWLEFRKIDGKAGLGLNKEKTKEFLATIAEEINVETREAKFQVSDSRVTEFQAPANGLLLNIKQTCQNLENKVIYRQGKSVEIVVDVTEPKTVLENSNDLGIKELLGRGVSDFSGSPFNRRHNIRVGADTLNGLLVKPDEEFSIIQSLGNIDASTGYLPELVIKGDRTIPEYGGGLCQIGTTAFRVALDAGVPITERRPHSYRVSYYEPAGTDATIYDPHPDLRFINDTGNYILWQTRINGNELIFEFWGTSDGRKVTNTEPKIFNITYPGPAQYIETDELEPGEEKQIERAHNGADTEFTRMIEYADDKVEEEVWASHYKAWPEVYLVGKELEEEGEESEEDEEEQAEEEDGVKEEEK